MDPLDFELPYYYQKMSIRAATSWICYQNNSHLLFNSTAVPDYRCQRPKSTHTSDCFLTGVLERSWAHYCSLVSSVLRFLANRILNNSSLGFLSRHGSTTSKLAMNSAPSFITTNRILNLENWFFRVCST